MARWIGQCVAVVSVPANERQNVTWRLAVLLDPPEERGSLLRVRWLKVSGRSGQGITVVWAGQEGRILRNCILVHQVDLLSSDLHKRFPPEPILGYQGVFRLLPSTQRKLEEWCKLGHLRSDFCAKADPSSEMPDRRLEYTPVTPILQNLLAASKDKKTDPATLLAERAEYLEKLNREFALCQDQQRLLEIMRAEVCGVETGAVVAHSCVGCTKEIWRQANQLLCHLVPNVRTAESFKELRSHYAALHRASVSIPGVQNRDDIVRVAQAIRRPAAQ
eukprot:Hpha_TRINITY_DN19931_c0_g1::TRINITY_DN19931_c0_g1_i1::g.93641::m.93641